MGQHLSNLQQRRLSRRVSPLQTERQRVSELESQLIAELQERAHELENQLSKTQGEVDKLKRQLREASNQRDWVINQSEIQIMRDVELGRGAWGTVYKGTFHGCDVAVKEMYENIMSPYTRHVFEREVSMASKCRHPCLLQFIGATTDVRPLLVTELMDCSLRERLNTRGGQLLSVNEVPVISLDVARALNYLHHKPTPIVHNDVSSANVLLWRRDDQWRAKLSDYGTVKFVRESSINYAGAAIYSAPEFQNENPDPGQQPLSCKVDVYSFGVLLCEMCILEDPIPEERERQINDITNSDFRSLVGRCVKREPMQRLNMKEVIQELEGLQEEDLD